MGKKRYEICLDGRRGGKGLVGHSYIEQRKKRRRVTRSEVKKTERVCPSQY